MYTREQLIEICKKGKAKYQDWMDRDSYSAQRSLMMTQLLLESDCEFKVKTKENSNEGCSCITDERTIWIEIFYDDWEDGESWHTTYLPTEQRLESVKGGDWY